MPRYIWTVMFRAAEWRRRVVADQVSQLVGDKPLASPWRMCDIFFLFFLFVAKDRGVCVCKTQG